MPRPSGCFESNLPAAGRLTRHELHKTLFEHFDQQLVSQGCRAQKGQIIDASFVDVPRQRNSREENAQLKAGETPERYVVSGPIAPTRSQANEEELAALRLRSHIHRKGQRFDWLIDHGTNRSQKLRNGPIPVNPGREFELNMSLVL